LDRPITLAFLRAGARAPSGVLCETETEKLPPSREGGAAHHP
jgi:hypothetical protein